MAPALGQGTSQRMQQPPPSAQITPRVQPSVLPTPRQVGAMPPPPTLPLLANGSSRQLEPLAAAAALQVSMPEDKPAAAEDCGEDGVTAAATADDLVSPTALISWRSDAVLLPEQQFLPDGVPASPTGAGAASNPNTARTATPRDALPPQRTG